MIKYPTVLIVGAGASSEFNMPLGPELKTRVGQILRPSSNQNGEKHNYHYLLETICKKFSIEKSQIHEAAGHIVDFIDATDSIDNVLLYTANINGATHIGKLAIIQAIIEGERSSNLYNDEGRSDHISKPSTINCWMRHFLSMLVSGHTRENLRDMFRNITFINFNYDRIIQRYTYLFLTRECAIPHEQVVEIIDSINIITPYGSIGQLFGDNGISFGADNISTQKMSESIENLYTFTEQREDDAMIEQIGRALYQSKVTLFLGFGYHQQNFDMLKIPKSAGDGNNYAGRVYATAYKIEQENYLRLEAKMRLNLKLSHSNEVKVLGWRSMELIEKMRPSIMD